MIRRHSVPQLDFSADGEMGRGAWFLDPAKAGGGAVMDLGVHAYDMCRHLLGLPKFKAVVGKRFAEVGPGRCAAKGITNRVDDMAAGYVTFAGGKAAQFEVTWDCHQRSETFMRAYGTRAGAEASGDTVTVYYDRNGKAAERTIKAPKNTPQSYDHFVEAILNPRMKMNASAEEAVEVMKVLDAIKTAH